MDLFDKKNQLEESNLRKSTFSYINFVYKNIIYLFLFIVISLIISFIYSRYEIPKFQGNIMVLIKDVDQNSSLLEDRIFSDITTLKSFNSLDNEIAVLKSRDVIEKIVDSLNLQVDYYTLGRLSGFKRTVIYKETPFLLYYSKKDAELLNNQNFLMQSIQDKVRIFDEEGNFDFKVNIGEEFSIPNSPVKFHIVKNNTSKYIDRVISVEVKDKNSTINEYMEGLQVNKVDEKNSSILDITFNSNCAEKSEDLLGTLYYIYNEYSIENNYIKIRNTDKFINERLVELGESLGSIESNIKDFKVTNEITDLNFETNESISRVSDLKKELSEASIQLELGKLMQVQLKKISSSELIPSNLGFEDLSIENAIISHNELVISLIKELKNSNSKNPKVSNLEKQIFEIRNSISRSVDNLVTAKNKIIDQAFQPLSDKKNRLTKFPEYEKVLRELNRNQKLKEEIFLYLLKKKEENKLAGSIISGKGVLIQAPYVQIDPISPNKIKIYAISLLLALFSFILLVYLKYQLKNVIGRKEDVINLGLKYIGSISNKDEKEYLVVKNGKKNKINEDFRKIRSSIFFSIEDGDKKLTCPVICITSHSPSEGKSFCSLNLAASFALVGKKVLLIDLDLRSPSLHKYLEVSNEIGMSDFLLNPTNDIFDLVSKPLESENFYFLNSGKIPSNPSELIMSNRFSNILDELKKRFDIIILDTPPISLVTDTNIILKMTDINLFISRMNYTRIEFLKNIKNIIESGNYENSYVLFNDEKFDALERYGYGYGHRYGYGYGSDYYIDEISPKRNWWNPLSWFKKK